MRNIPLACLLLGVALCARAADKTRTLSVCDLIAKRNDFNGKMVVVRGMVSGSNLVAWESCKYRLSTGGVMWPNWVYLSQTGMPSWPVSGHNPDFETDLDSYGRAYEKSEGRYFDPKTEVAVTTFIGQFETYSDAELGNRVAPGPNTYARYGLGGQRSGFGCCGAADAPAFLIVKYVKETAVLRRIVRYRQSKEKR